jgi:anti-sigma factor RsiW
MAERTEHNPNEIQLWRQYADGLEPSNRACPTDLELAGYLDGRLGDAGQSRVEAHLADCPACLEAVLEARALLEADAAGFIAPAEAVRRAQSLVPGSSQEQDVYRAAVRPWLAPSWTLWGQRTAAAVAGLALCLVGFRVGSMPSGAALQAEHEQLFLSEASFGLYGVNEGVDENLLPLELEVETP